VVSEVPEGGERPAVRTGRFRSTMSQDERAAQILQMVTAQPGALGYKDLADSLGVSSATATKTAKALQESGRIRATGERRSLRLHPA
jgi:DNA-binding IclR family transcriptional regulator